MLPVGALRILIEEKYGTLPHLLIYAVLEWLMIILLFVDGFLAFVSNEIARFFELRTPCLLCTRLDHVLVQRDSNFYYNDSICEVHKKDISALAYCRVHKRLSDIRSMCQGCLLNLNKDSDCATAVVDDDRRLQLKPLRMEINVPDERVGMFRCSCCGEPMKPKSSSKYNRSLSIGSLAPSPRTPWFSGRNNEGGNMDSLPSRYTELKLTSVSHSELQEGEEAAALVVNHGREDVKAVALLPEEMIEDVPRTPIFSTRNRFFGIPLTDAVPVSPSFASRSSKKLSEKLEILEPIDENEGEGDSLARLKRQATLDSRSLMALYMELDEERSASAVAANNAMAMITRLQAEKAAVQMEALQYQRMMEEQTEYDEEALQMMRDMLFKRDEEMKDLEVELEMYKEQYGIIKRIGSEICEVDLDEGYQEMNSDQALSSFSEKTDDQNENERAMDCPDELALDYEGERSHLLGLLRELENKMYSKTSTASVGDEENEAGLTREVSLIRERLRAVEGESGFLKHAAMILQRGGEGMKLLTEIAQHLRKLRQNIKSPEA
ncbi:hypothetical protein C2S51_035491 [Perilla frutescens var. frutescens]|nr:hypothetical protein C2S51_035491 [Perilla frutescens var. frutescens]